MGIEDSLKQNEILDGLLKQFSLKENMRFIIRDAHTIHCVSIS
jgi:hypothetical protein